MIGLRYLISFVINKYSIISIENKNVDTVSPFVLSVDNTTKEK